ncbi:MAG: glycosyltransferase family 4 protein [Verrucomicrobiota bacterium]|nr:glycosyltransferase family 4 protein [Verrucomicrobiota bacterium]
MVLLIGNYAPERQQSMLRFAAMMLEGLSAAGVEAELIQPQPFFGKLTFAGAFAAKWFAYIDKFILFPQRLKAKLRARPAVVHICDHSNAMYAKQIRSVPVVVTCHDLLAVRGGLGEETDCPASATGRLLQRWIVSGLRHAAAVACDSITTRDDARRIVTVGSDHPKLPVIKLGQSYPYRVLSASDAQARLSAVQFDLSRPYVLHVGSNLRRKNREGVLRIFARCQERWNGQLVIAGDALSESLRNLANTLGVSARVVEVVSPSNELLEALYNRATAFLFPSRFEGFGWPIIEAQACGCPVLTSSTNPMAEVAGDGALLRDPADEQGFADDLLSLVDSTQHATWSGKALENAKHFTTGKMIAEYRELYRSLAPAC